MLTLHVIIPTLGTRASELRVTALLENLAAQGIAPEAVTLVLDGASRVPRALSRSGGQVVLRRSRGGYGAACNTGFAAWRAHQPGPWLRRHAVLFLNDDVRFDEPAWQTAVQRLANSNVAAVGFSVVTPQGERPRYHGVKRSGGYVLASATLDGCAWAMRADLFQHLGGFDESYGMYGEETDLFTRAMQLGKILWEADAQVFHNEGLSAQRQPVRASWYGYRNPLRHALRNESPQVIAHTVASQLGHAVLPRAVNLGEAAHIRRKRAQPLVVRLALTAASLGDAAIHVREALAIRREAAQGNVRRGDLDHHTVAGQ